MSSASGLFVATGRPFTQNRSEGDAGQAFYDTASPAEGSCRRPASRLRLKHDFSKMFGLVVWDEVCYNKEGWGNGNFQDLRIGEW